VPDLPELGIELSGVRKSFGSQAALQGVDLSIAQGSYVAVMGPNGAGKTTMLKIMAGLSAPTKGSVRVAGIEMRRAGPALRRQVGFVSHESMLYHDLSAWENLVFNAKLFGVTRPEEVVAAIAERLDVSKHLRKPVRALSRGTRQRVAVARALLHNPRVLLMDEPYTGLDEIAATSLSDLLVELHTPERTLIITVHEVFRALTGPERLVAIARGKIALDRSIKGDEEEITGAYRELLRADSLGARA